MSGCTHVLEDIKVLIQILKVSGTPIEEKVKKDNSKTNKKQGRHRWWSPSVSRNSHYEKLIKGWEGGGVLLRKTSPMKGLVQFTFVGTFNVEGLLEGYPVYYC